MTCFRCDAQNCSNHSFHNFLAPKSSSFTTYNNNNISSMDDMPDLSNSIYTNSSTFSKASSSSSIFTRRSDLVSRGLIKIDDKKDDDEVACCDYCENLKDENLISSPSLSSWSKKPYSKDQPLNNIIVMLSVK